MTYQLGVDLGTTWVAAATARDARVETVALGNRGSTLPSVAYVGADGTVLIGEAAERRSVLEPTLVAREFKRAVGSTPMPLGTGTVEAHELMGLLFAAVLDIVTEREGGPPDTIAVTHPANWNAARVSLLRAALDPRNAELVTVSEPEAAAVCYDNASRVPIGTTVAVYDLGGGTFDAVLLRREADGMHIVGRPAGIERLGGIDFDSAVFAHVKRMLGSDFERLDHSQPAVAAAVARLRADCVDAKEALSVDTQAQIAVLLPGLQTEIRLTRNELEAMVRPALRETIACVHRTIADAGLAVEDIDVVLAVGGSSRLPLVTQLLTSELGRPVALDADPKHVVAKGAAVFAASAAQRSAGTGTGAASATGAATGGEGAAPDPASSPGPTPTPAPAAAPTAAPTAAPSPAPTPSTPAAAPTAGAPRRSGRLVAVGIAAVAVVAVIAAVALLGGGSGGGGEVAAANTTEAGQPAADAATPTTNAAGAGATTDAQAPATTTAEVALPPACASLASPSVCLTTIDFSRTDGDDIAEEGDYLVADFVPTGFDPSPGRPVHVFFPPSDPSSNQRWTRPSPYRNGAGLTTLTVGGARRSDATQLCALATDADRNPIPGSGNCIDLPRQVLQ